MLAGLGRPRWSYYWIFLHYNKFLIDDELLIFAPFLSLVKLPYASFCIECIIEINSLLNHNPFQDTGQSALISFVTILLLSRELRQSWVIFYSVFRHNIEFQLNITYYSMPCPSILPSHIPHHFNLRVNHLSRHLLNFPFGHCVVQGNYEKFESIKLFNMLKLPRAHTKIRLSGTGPWNAVAPLCQLPSPW